MAATEAHMRATAKFEAKAYDKILLRTRKDGPTSKECIQVAADRAGKSLNGYILEAVQEKIDREK